MINSPDNCQQLIPRGTVVLLRFRKYTAEVFDDFFFLVLHLWQYGTYSDVFASVSKMNIPDDWGYDRIGLEHSAFFNLLKAASHSAVLVKWDETSNPSVCAEEQQYQQTRWQCQETPDFVLISWSWPIVNCTDLRFLSFDPVCWNSIPQEFYFFLEKETFLQIQHQVCHLHST